MECVVRKWCSTVVNSWPYIGGLVQDCSNSIANALELLYCSLALSHRYVNLCRFWKKTHCDPSMPLVNNGADNCLLPGSTVSPSQHKDRLSRYVDFHYKDKTVVRPFYLYNGDPYTGKMTSYWDSPQIITRTMIVLSIGIFQATLPDAYAPNVINEMYNLYFKMRITLPRNK